MAKKKGFVRSDGMVLWSTRKNGYEWWMTREQFDAKDAKLKRKSRERYVEGKQKIHRDPSYKRGFIREDGMVFWGYDPRADIGQVWMTQEQFEAKQQWKRNHNQQWAAENAERMNYLKRRWDKNNPEKVKLLHAKTRHRRRARKRKNGGKVSASELASLQRASGGYCHYCGKKKRLSFDHVVPLKLGGKNTIDNMVMACLNCNSQKQAQDPLVYAKKIGRLLI